jgi:hypothetical protein
VTTSGFHAIVGDGERPAIVTEPKIETIRQLMETRLEVEVLQQSAATEVDAGTVERVVEAAARHGLRSPGSSYPSYPSYRPVRVLTPVV